MMLRTPVTVLGLEGVEISASLDVGQGKKVVLENLEILASPAVGQGKMAQTAR